MKAKKPKRPESDAERAAAARSIARKVLDEPLPSWGREQRVSVFREASGRIRIVRGGELAIVCAPDVVPEDFATLQDFRGFIMLLIDLLEEQAMIAGWTHPLAAIRGRDLNGAMMAARVNEVSIEDLEGLVFRGERYEP
jgi:hypothetical protein